MTLTVEENRPVKLCAINQAFTYDGLIEGLPHDRMNAKIVEAAVEEAGQVFGNRQVYLVEPTQTPIEYKGTYPFGIPMALPAVLCMAELLHHQPVRSEDADYSSLVVVWFQQEFALPIDPTVLSKFSAIPWAEAAGDFEL